MTRINVAIPPKELCRQHLLAETREIKRIPNLIAKGKYKLTNIPPHFKLGTGHVTFFYNKLLYLKNRYEELYQECVERKYNPTYFGNAWDNLPPHLMNDYTPTEQDRLIVQQRINESLLRMATKKAKKNANN